MHLDPALVKAVNKAKLDHYTATGEVLPIRAARELANRETAAAIVNICTGPALALVGSHREFPIPRHLYRATLLLLELEYTAPAIDSILTHLNRYGSGVGCIYIDANHRDMVEDTLPMSPEWSDPAWEAEVWNAADDRDFDDEGFEVPSEPSGVRELVEAY